MPGGEDSNSSPLSQDATTISHVAIKPPPFYLKSPATWFRQLESQFALSKITNSTTKFHHVLAALPEDVVCDLAIDEVEDYEALKKAVIESLSANKHQLISEALSAVPIGDKRPTQYVAEAKRKFSDIGLPIEDKIIKSKLISALPSNIKAALVGHENETLDSFAKIADSMMAVAGPQTQPYNIGTVQSSSHQSRYNGDHSSSRNYHNEGQGYRRHQNSRYDVTSVRSFRPNQRPKICNAHIFYAANARTCRSWCQWPKKEGRVLHDREKTPVQSRASSPAKND